MDTARQRILDSVQIARQCPASWDLMSGDGYDTSSGIFFENKHHGRYGQVENIPPVEYFSAHDDIIRGRHRFLRHNPNLELIKLRCQANRELWR